MNIALRVDSSNKVGIGHLHRCLTLAKELNKKNKIFFISRKLKNNENDLVPSLGFKLNKINGLKKENSSKINLEYDKQQTIKIIKTNNIKLLIVDNYEINYNWEKTISKYCKILLIHDFLERKSYCDYFLNYHFLKANFFVKKKLKKNCKFLIGNQYAIIKKKIFIKKRIERKSIFIYLGSVDSSEITESSLNELIKNKYKEQINVVLGNQNQNKKKILKKFNKYKNIKFFKPNKKNLYNYTSKSNLIISGAGISMYENIINNSNMIVFNKNKIHKSITLNLKKISNVKFANNKDELKKLIKKEIDNKINKNYLKNKRSVLPIVDSHGVTRITNIINGLKNNSFYLRKAKLKDIFFLYFLKNDSINRKSAFNQNYVTLTNHIKWFKTKSSQKNFLIFIFKNKENYIGQVSFKFLNINTCKIDYAISNEFRGNGYSKIMLQKAFGHINKKTVIAEVKNNNIASKKIFNFLKFHLVNKNKNRLLFRKTILND